MILPTPEFWTLFKKTVGAFSTPEAICLMNVASEAPQGGYLELGSHKGKSSISAAYGLKGGVFYLVEPEFKDEDWKKSVDKLVFEVNNQLKRILIADYSTNVIPKMDDLSFVFVDSGVHDDLVMEEVKMLEDKIVPRGIIAFHDYLNQFTAVERAYDYLLSTGKYEKIEINWDEIFDYVRDNNLEEGNNSWHEKGSKEFPCFVGALKRK